MKLTTLKNSGIALLSLFTLISCVKDDDYELPEIKKELPKFDGTIVPFASVANKTTATVATYTANEAIEGYVISSDEGGNFYQKIYIQSADGTQGVSVAIEEGNHYLEFPLGAKVQLRLKDLSTQLNNAAVDIGYKTYTSGNYTNVGRIPKSLYKNYLFDTGERKPVAQLAKEFTSIAEAATDAHLNQLITLKNVHFPIKSVGKTLYDKGNLAGKATNYNLTDAAGKHLIFRTSDHAKFKDEKVPAGTVNVTGVLTKFNKDYQFLISNYTDLVVVGGTVTQTQTATVETIEAATANASIYEKDKVVKIHGTSITKGGKAHFKLSDETLIQVYINNKNTKISNEVKEKLATEGYELTVKGKLGEYNGTKQIEVSEEADIVFGTAPAAPTYTPLEATTATVADYANGKYVKLHGNITVEGKHSYIVLKDNTKIQLYAANFGSISKEKAEKLKVAGQEVTISGKFEEYNPNPNEVVRELIYVKDTDIELGTASTPQPPTPAITAIDAAQAKSADFTNNIGKAVKLTGTLVDENGKSHIKFSDGTDLQLYVPNYGKLPASFKNKMKAGAKVAITGTFKIFDDKKNNKKINQIAYTKVEDVEFL